MMNLIIASITITTFCTAQGRPRPHPKPLPQERRARPWFQISPRHEDPLGKLVSSRWKLPFSPEDGHWKRELKGEWIWRDKKIGNTLNRWKPVQTKKATHLLSSTANNNFRKVKKTGPKHGLHHKNYFATNKRITNKIDKSIPGKNTRRLQVNHRRPGPNFDKKFWSHSTNINRPLKLVNHLNGDGRKAKAKVQDGYVRYVDVTASSRHPSHQKLSNIKQDTLVPDKEVDGKKIYMFKGNEGIGNFNYNQIHANTFTSLPSKSQLTRETDKILKSAFERLSFTTTTFASVEADTSVSISSARHTTPPPFPTRHTTSRTRHHENPIIIISQSSVMQNY